MPLTVPAPIAPHATTQSPTQFVTVHPVAGHVTWHSGLLPQSTMQLVEVAHCTWHQPPGTQDAVHG